MNVLMSIVDYIPVALFLAAGIIYQRDLYNKMSKGAFALFSSGIIFVFVAGVFKATQKILYYTGACNWQALSNCFFPMQTTGFVLAAAGCIATMVHPQGEHRAYSITLPLLAVGLAEAVSSAADEVPVFSGTMVFVGFMVAGVAIMDGLLIYIAVKMKSPLAIVFIAIAFVCTMGMGYLSTKPELSDWIKEIINTVGQASFLASALLLRKAGLGKPDALNGIARYLKEGSSAE